MGKELKVIEYELSFGKAARIVNVYSVFRYKKNNNLYIIYGDIDNNYNTIYYGSSHIKNTSVLSMSTKEEESEIIKEFIFKITGKEELDNFEIISLDNIDGIEIISSNHLELKPEIISSLTDLTIPKKKEKVKQVEKKVKKRSGVGKLFPIFIILIAAIGIYYYFSTISHDNIVTKTITCKKTSSENNLNASKEENNVYLFDINDTLKSVETTSIYHFNTKEDYENFIYNGTMYRYMPNDKFNGGYKQNDEEHSFTIIVKEEVNDNYRKPTNYEEVLSYYKRDGYTCDEKLLGE